MVQAEVLGGPTVTRQGEAAQAEVQGGLTQRKAEVLEEVAGEQPHHCQRQPPGCRRTLCQEGVLGAAARGLAGRHPAVWVPMLWGQSRLPWRQQLLDEVEELAQLGRNACPLAPPPTPLPFPSATVAAW